MRKRCQIQVKGKTYTLGLRTWIMGVLNITPDSFSDGGLFFNKDQAIQRGLTQIAEGADILDIGGESTRPGSESVTFEEEQRRVLPVISSLRKKTDALISIDTTKAEVAHAALDEGADMINDISAGRNDPDMFSLAAEKNAPLILMHMQGTPKTMQNNPHYKDLFSEIKEFFEERMRAAHDAGVPEDKIIIDPGIGFGKALSHNLALIRNLDFLNAMGKPICIGTSRKSFIGKILDLPTQERLEGTIASCILSLLNGAHILRVHDVAAVKRAVRVAEAILTGNKENSSVEMGRNIRRTNAI